MALANADCNLEKCFDALRKILIKTAKVDGETQFQHTLFEKISFDDNKTLLGWYIKHFLYTFLAD